MSQDEASPRPEGYEPSSQTGVVSFLVDLAWMLFVLFVVAYVAGAIYGVARSESNPVQSNVLSFDAELIRSDLQAPSGVSIAENPKVSIDIRHPTRAQVAWSTIALLAKAVIVGLVLWFLRGLAGSAKEGEPFAPANVRRLRGIGFALAFGAPVAQGLSNWADDRLLASLPASTTIHFTREAFGFPFELVLAGMGAFILAAVFAYGVRLREDVEATV